MKYLNNILFVNFVSKALYSYLIKYPTPMNINYLWNFGFMSAIFLVIQIVSGLFSTFFFTPHVDLAFFSVEHIMRDVNYGWLIRYIHANGASFFFFLVYIHILKGIYYGSYYFPRTLVWFTGVIIYILMMGTAFLGHVLPWGQMSYWAATVITNFVTVIPVVGKDIVYWVWGGYSINNATLNRFFSLHHLLPFVIALLSVYHIYQLHKSGSSNELGIRSHYLNKISFYPYFLVKDFFGLFIILFVFSIFVFFFPEAFNHSDNYIKANPLVTPAHIVPEWYFLPLYGILRSILNKTYGIIIMFVSLLVLFVLPFVDKSLIKNKTFKPFNRTLFWFFSFNFLFLGYLGSQAPVYPYIEFGVICSHFHLLYFFLLIPLSVFFESSFFNYFFSSNETRGNFSFIYWLIGAGFVCSTLFISYYLGVSNGVNSVVVSLVDNLYILDPVHVELGLRDAEITKYTNLINNELEFTSSIFSCLWNFIVTKFFFYITTIAIFLALIKL